MPANLSLYARFATVQAIVCQKLTLPAITRAGLQNTWLRESVPTLESFIVAEVTRDSIAIRLTPAGVAQPARMLGVG